ncbi:MAG: hypothetical protein K9G46_07170 [Flavobacteriales bacterium]|nr:hypothetical protein [Flavobacteriales bacterium]
MKCSEGVEIFCKNSFRLVGYNSNEDCLKRELPAQCPGLSFWAKAALLGGALILIGGIYYMIKK